jgi:hypothetical protein
MKFFNFILLLWVIFALLDPDPDSGSGSTDPIESGSATLVFVPARQAGNRFLGTSKQDISQVVSTFVGHFCPCKFGSNPDPKH